MDLLEKLKLTLNSQTEKMYKRCVEASQSSIWLTKTDENMLGPRNEVYLLPMDLREEALHPHCHTSTRASWKTTVNHLLLQRLRPREHPSDTWRCYICRYKSNRSEGEHTWHWIRRSNIKTTYLMRTSPKLPVKAPSTNSSVLASCWHQKHKHKSGLVFTIKPNDNHQPTLTLKRQKVTVFYMYGVVFKQDRVHILKWPPNETY